MSLLKKIRQSILFHPIHGTAFWIIFITFVFLIIKKLYV